MSGGTAISFEAPDLFVGPRRPPIPKERRRFPDTIDLEFDPNKLVDPEHDDSAVSVDTPTYFQTNKFINVRQTKPRWQVRQSQEKLAANVKMTEEEVAAAAANYGLQLYYDPNLHDIHYTKKVEDAPKKVHHVHDGADARKHRHTTGRERKCRSSTKSKAQRIREMQEQRINYAQQLMDAFDTTLLHTDKHSAQITQIDTAAVKKPIGAPCSLFL